MESGASTQFRVKIGAPRIVSPSHEISSSHHLSTPFVYRSYKLFTRDLFSP